MLIVLVTSSMSLEKASTNEYVTIRKGMADTLVRYQQICIQYQNESIECNKLNYINKDIINECNNNLLNYKKKDSLHYEMLKNDSIFINKCNDRVEYLETVGKVYGVVGFATFLLGTLTGYLLSH